MSGVTLLWRHQGKIGRRGGGGETRTAVRISHTQVSEVLGPPYLGLSY
jgi:hypothetical protein